MARKPRNKNRPRPGKPEDTDPVVKEFCKNLERLIQERGITKQEFAARMGTSPVHLSRVINDKQHPTLTWVAKAARALNIPVRDLFAEPVESV